MVKTALSILFVHSAVAWIVWFIGYPLSIKIRASRFNHYLYFVGMAILVITMDIIAIALNIMKLYAY